MRCAVPFVAFALCCSLLPAPAHAFTRQPARFDAWTLPPDILAVDCTLNSANLCAGWIWTFDDVEGAVWGTVLSPGDCSISCSDGGGVEEIILYSRCSEVPGRIANVGLSKVDAVGCRTSLLYNTGPLTVTHCVYGDRWTRIVLPTTHIQGEPFAVTVTWGPQTGGTNNPQLATDNGIANLYCHQNPGSFPVFPGCTTSTSDCSAWSLPSQHTFIYVTDFNGDGVLDDICALYGAPYPLAFPYFYPYGYLPNNLMIAVGLDCHAPTAVEPTSWGKVKALYQ
jgi:hypothetical protein